MPLLVLRGHHKQQTESDHLPTASRGGHLPCSFANLNMSILTLHFGGGGGKGVLYTYLCFFSKKGFFEVGGSHELIIIVSIY